MSNPTQNHAESIAHYLVGLSAHPGALEQLQLSLLTHPEDWRTLAIHRLRMRQTTLLDAMSNAELEAIGTGQVDLWSITQTVATAQAADPLDDRQADATPDASILETIELIAQRKLGRTVQTRNSDRLDFFEVHAARVQDALLAAFMAGMQVKNA
jgi:hypothetical protein